MGMKARVLPLMIVAAALAAPAYAVAAGALNQARAVAGDPVNFDGGVARPEGDLVPAGASTDNRTAAQIAKDEQARSDARARSAAPSLGADVDHPPKKDNEWLKAGHITSGVRGALVGLLIGSLWGLMGLGIGALIGGLIGYALSRFAAKDE